MEKGVISNSQFAILVILFMVGSSTLIAPPLLVLEAKQDAWISGLLAVGLGLLIASLHGALAFRYPKLNLIEKCERILGKWPGKAVAWMFILYFLLLTAALVRIIGDFITTLIMPETPIQAIEIALMLTVILGVRLGLEVFARTAEVLVPWVLLFYAILVMSLLPEFQLNRMAPVMEEGIRPILYGIYPLLGIPYLDLIIFVMITPYVSRIRKTGANLRTGVIIGGLILAANGFLTVSVLGAEQTANLYYPLFTLTQKIHLGRFVQRVEVLAGGIFFISLFVKIVICFYATCLGVSRVMGFRDYKPYTYPLGMLIIGLSLHISPNIVYFQQFALKSWTPLCLIFGLVLPLLLLFTARLRMEADPSSNQGEQR